MAVRNFKLSETRFNVGQIDRIVPDTASYIRGWIQMVLAPNYLFSWNNEYNKYNEYNITDTFTCIFLAVHTTYSVHAGILKSWRGRLPWLRVIFSSYHVFSLPLSGLNWRSSFPPWGSGHAHPLTGIRNKNDHWGTFYSYFNKHISVIFVHGNNIFMF